MKAFLSLAVLSVMAAKLTAASPTYVWNADQKSYYYFGTGPFTGVQIRNGSGMASFIPWTDNLDAPNHLIYATDCALLTEEGHWFLSSFNEDNEECHGANPGHACVWLSIDDQMACPSTCPHDNPKTYGDGNPKYCHCDAPGVYTHRGCCTGRTVYNPAKSLLTQETFKNKTNPYEYWLPYRVSGTSDKYYFKNAKAGTCITITDKISPDYASKNLHIVELQTCDPSNYNQYWTWFNY
ncbi:hypothetical protein BC937DRAFT_89752 [Endogone sp. FLAS-F59071]|nr:hypothetical protein BC937DRAFT_89752 [Endogone sp. FLAS-F59071]|eukprot:RUS17604.1 hypothetical protein BC937DRAFT_89752 [Endogone sp. FLAS-F59071]